MAKVSGAYESVVRGVSQQVPQDRLSGQHTAQTNMVSDPVHGLSRRHGSVTVGEAALPHDYADLLANTTGHRTHSFTSGGAQYDLLHRTGQREVVSEFDDTLFCFSRDTSTFLPVVLHETIATDALRHAGVSALVQVGRFTLMAGNGYQTTWSEEPRYETSENLSRFAIWIRGGAYSRKFELTLTEALTGAKTVISYTTASASYPTLLDTSGISTSDPDYQKLVNDMVYAYNSQVTAWIGTSAADSVPSNIAAKLKIAYDALGFGPATLAGSTLIIEDTRWGEVSITDGGDNSLADAVGNVVETAEDVCPVHFVGKVVKVRPSKESPDSAYYLQAYASDERSSGVTAVTWREGCATHYTPTRLFVVATVYEGVLYVSDDLEWLESHVGATDDDVPGYRKSLVGDNLTNQLPNFFGQSIDYLGMIQDRLVVGCGSVLNMSKRGDYYNFFRSTVLSILDDDPVEMYPLGAEEDVIKYDTPFNRDLILYGEQGQYVISGDSIITPKSASIQRLSKYAGSIDAPPKACGMFAYYATKRGTTGQLVTALHQVQPAALSSNPESQDVSQQLDGYIEGTAIELVALATPNVNLLRTDASRTRLYLYNYLDRANGERVLDAWHDWEWGQALGNMVGIAQSDKGDILVYVIREGSTGTAYLACERFTLSGVTSSVPYMDALRSEAVPGSLAGLAPPLLGVAYGRGPKSFEGATMTRLAAYPEVMTGAYLGLLFDSKVTPTNPFPKDRQGKAISFGRMTLGTVQISVADTGGLIMSTNRDGAVATVLDFNGFLVSNPEALPGTQPILTTTLQGFVGGEVRECSYTLTSKRWLPLTITALEWAGQLFNRERRS